MKTDALPSGFVVLALTLTLLVCLWSYIWAVFPVNDGLVEAMTDTDWQVQAALNALATLVRAVVTAAVVWGLGALAVRSYAHDDGYRRDGYRQAVQVAVVCAVLVCAAGWTGAVQFLIERPIF